jgi:hypothetical protein
VSPMPDIFIIRRDPPFSLYVHSKYTFYIKCLGSDVGWLESLLNVHVLLGVSHILYRRDWFCPLWCVVNVAVTLRRPLAGTVPTTKYFLKGAQYFLKGAPRTGQNPLPSLCLAGNCHSFSFCLRPPLSSTLLTQILLQALYLASSSRRSLLLCHYFRPGIAEPI